MTVLEQKKYRLIRAIMDDTNEKRVLKVAQLYHIEEERPCMYTIEEIKASLPEIEREFVEGNGIPHDEVMKAYGL